MEMTQIAKSAKIVDHDDFFVNISIATKVPDSVYSSVLKLCEQKKKEMELYERSFFWII